MKWTLKLERADEACNLHSTTVGHVERPELTSEADLGLAHEDGEYLIRQLQAEIALDQPGLCSQSPTQGAGSRVRLASASPAACSPPPSAASITDARRVSISVSMRHRRLSLVLVRSQVRLESQMKPNYSLRFVVQRRRSVVEFIGRPSATW